jgi:hypothetical protein
VWGPKGVGAQVVELDVAIVIPRAYAPLFVVVAGSWGGVLQVEGLGLRVWGLGFGVEVFGLRVEG